MIDKDKIWIFLPAFNEATIIKNVIKDIKTIGYQNIVVINDGSTDKTVEIAKKEKVKVISLSINQGVGVAIRTGIAFAKRKNFEIIVFLDADGQHHPQDIDNLVHAMNNQNADVVIGSRFINKKSNIPKSRIVFNKIANIFTHFGKATVTDSQSGFRLLTKKAINSLNLELDGYGTCTEMVWEVNKYHLKLVETPINVNYTTYSKSKGQNLWKGIQTAFYLIKNRLYEH